MFSTDRKCIDQTKEANRGIETCELYQYGHQYVQSQNPYENRSPICIKVNIKKG